MSDGLTVHSVAAQMDGREYSGEISKQEERQLKEAGLVVVFGYSDDNLELRGVVDVTNV